MAAALHGPRVGPMPLATATEQWEDLACRVMRTGALDDVVRHEPSCPVALPTVLRRGLVLPGIGALGAVYSAAAEAATLRDWSTREVHGFMLRELSLVTDCVPYLRSGSGCRWRTSWPVHDVSRTRSVACTRC